MDNAPCKKNGIDCPNRVLGCHDNCKEYQAFAAHRERMLKKIRTEEAFERDYNNAFWKRKKNRR